LIQAGRRMPQIGNRFD